VKRRRSSAPGRLRPDGRWSHSILLVVLLAVLLAACGAATGTDRPTASVGSPSDGVPAGTATTDPSTVAPTADPPVTAEPTTPEPTETAATSSPAGPSTGPGSAAACSGSDENRDFFASMAAAVDWTVYCPVVPDGWFVQDGHYRLANGGWMEIVYDGPADAEFGLRQGALGDAAGGCVPPGPQVADAAFGDQTGVLIDVSTGGWAVVVDRGDPICWVIVVAGLDEADARTIAADLHAVAG
jgi:hypothetical protein